MKRFLLVLVLAAAAAFAIWFGMRGKSLTIASKATVTALLPRDTLVLVHVPDINRTRDQWHESDLYKLWREPAVQAFLQRPLTKMPQAEKARQQFEDLSALGMRDAFLAVTTWDNAGPKIAAGFRFNGTPADAEKVIGRWRARAEQGGGSATTHSTVDYQQHHLEIATHETVNLATAYDGEWFLAANDVDVLKTLLDRVDGRAKDAAATLHADETYTAASKHLPAGYAAAAFVRVDRALEHVIARLPEGATNPQFTALRQIRSIAAASSFENGKVRHVLFVGRPKAEAAGTLTRSSLNLTTANTFLYTVSIAEFPKNLSAPAGSPTIAPPSALASTAQMLLSRFASNGINADEWRAAFGDEVSVIGDWPETTRIPALLATIPVKDAAKANSLLATATRVADEDRPWTATTRDGVQYYTLPPTNPMMPIAPTIALTNQLLVAGFDAGSVDAALQRAGSSGSPLADSATFKSAQGRVAEPTTMFGYVDMAQLYTRLDAALRPMLVMAAAFMPGIAESVELDKLPPAEVITRHLSPLVVSQNYRDDGYVTESVGAISAAQAVLGAGALSGAAAALYQHNVPAGTALSSGAQPPALPSPTAAPTASTSPTNDDDENGG